MKKWFLLICFALISLVYVSSASNGRFVAFYVIDAETREELPLVSISIDGHALGVSTDLEGRASIDGVPPTATSFTVSYVGYQSQTHRLLNYNTCLYQIELVADK